MLNLIAFGFSTKVRQIWYYTLFHIKVMKKGWMILLTNFSMENEPKIDCRYDIIFVLSWKNAHWSRISAADTQCSGKYQDFRSRGQTEIWVITMSTTMEYSLQQKMVWKVVHDLQQKQICLYNANLQITQSPDCYQPTAERATLPKKDFLTWISA